MKLVDSLISAGSRYQNIEITKFIDSQGDEYGKTTVTSEYEKAIQYIYSLMQDGTLQNGSKLPTERTIRRR